MKRCIQIFDSFDKADEAELKERWAMSPDRRLEILEHLRSLNYPDGKTAGRDKDLLDLNNLPEANPSE